MRNNKVFRIGRVLVCGLAGLLVSCGGSGLFEDWRSKLRPQAAESCDTASQKTALLDYMQVGYLWADLAPRPAPEGYDRLEQYFAALLFTGSASVPADRWSYLSDSAQYNQFFQDGQTLGYGIFVNGLEAQLPLKIRYVEPQSPAAKQGLKRGDTIVSINGVSAAALLASGNFAALSPDKEGDAVVLQMEGNDGARTMAVVAATYDLQPVAVQGVLTRNDGKKVGYVSLKDFITQAEQPLDDAIKGIRAEGATDIIVDLRYNGGGRISTTAKLASLIAGSAHDGKVFVHLQHNAQVSYLDSDFTLASSASGFSRAVILTGSRTCSASELLANGLKPYMEVITLGSQTCGKPFGFQPVELCEKTISAVNFESFNAAGEGRYYQGIAPGCSVKDDFSGLLGDPQETLTAAALTRLQTGQCPTNVPAARLMTQTPGNRRTVVEPGEFRGMRAD